MEEIKEMDSLEAQGLEQGLIIKGGSVLKYDGSKSTVSVPFGVTKIAKNAFLDNCGDLEEIILPESLNSIGWGAFFGCSNLTSVKIPDSVTVIGGSAFTRCSGLESVTVGAGVEVIEGWAFAHCSSLENIEINGGITKIENHTFCGCTSLTSIELPSTVEAIEESAFYNCRSLEKIQMNTGLTRIGEQAFCGCSSLTSIELPSTVELIEDGAFDGCGALMEIKIENSELFVSVDGVLYNKDRTELVKYPMGKTDKKFTVPSSVVTLHKDCFGRCVHLKEFETQDGGCLKSFDGVLYSSDMTRLICCPAGRTETELKIKDGTVTVGASAFRDCSGLEYISIPESVREIEEYAFFCCSTLLALTLPQSVETIGKSAFSGCDALTVVYTPLTQRPEGWDEDELDDIGSAVLWGVAEAPRDLDGDGMCIRHGVLTSYYGDENSVTIPEGVIAIGNGAFQGNDSLESVTVPDSVIIIGNEAFSECTSLEKVKLGNGVADIRGNAFYGCGFLTDIVLPDSVTRIGSGAFKNCLFLGEINIPKFITVIESSTFEGCSCLKSVIIPEGVTDINEEAFHFCLSLEEINIPSSVTGLLDDAFNGCASLKSIRIPKSIKYMGSNVFDSCGEELTDIYCEASAPPEEFGWDEDWLGDCTATVHWSEKKDDTSKSDEMVIEDGVLKRYSGNPIHVKIPEGVTEIGEDAFYFKECLESVELPESLTVIGENAFKYCFELKSVKIPDGVTNIGVGAFSGCRSLNEIIVGERNSAYTVIDGVLYDKDITTLKHYLRKKADKSFTVPDSVTVIENDAFAYGVNLESITIPDGVLEIGDSAFFCCTSLTSITIPSSVGKVGIGLFQDECVALTDIYCEAFEKPYGWDEDWRGDCDAKVHWGVKRGEETTKGEADEALASEETGIVSENTEQTSPTFVGGTEGLIIENGVVTGYTGTDTEVVVPMGVTEIGFFAFSANMEIKSVKLPESVKVINNGAFSLCPFLSSVNLPSGLERLMGSAFFECHSLTKITVPEGVKVIEEMTFANCKSLFGIKMGNAVTKIEKSAFAGCERLESIELPSSINSIDGHAFFGCSASLRIVIKKSKKATKGFHKDWNLRKDGGLFNKRVKVKYEG